MKNLIATLFAVVVLSATFLFAQEPVTENVSEIQDSVAWLKQEIALRDSLMAVGDSACTAEKDSLRGALALSNAMGDSWKQSYETMRKDGEACARAQNVAMAEDEYQDDEEVSSEKSEGFSTTAVASSFVGGLGIGMLLFWLIFE